MKMSETGLVGVQCPIKGPSLSRYKETCSQSGINPVVLIKVHLLLQHFILFLIHSNDQQFSCCLGKIIIWFPRVTNGSRAARVSPQCSFSSRCPPQLENCPHCLMLRQSQFIICPYFSSRTNIWPLAQNCYIFSHVNT